MQNGRDAAAHGLERHSVIAALAAAGIIGPVIFVTLALVQSLLRPEHSFVSDPISALAAGPSGWVQDMNFLLFGCFMMAYAIGLHRGVRPTRWGAVSPAFLVLSGLGLMWAGLFPATDPSGAFQENRLLHIPGFIMTFLGAATGLMLMSRRMARDPRWKNLPTYALATGAAMLLLLLAGARFVRPSTAPLHPWWGLFQWILLAVWLPCTVALARRQVRVARAAAMSYGSQIPSEV
jgi:hypothetical membrane protein